MHRKKPLWQLFPIYVLILLTSLFFIAFYTAILFQEWDAQKTLSIIFIKIIATGFLTAFIASLIIYKVSRGISYPLERGNKEQETVLSNMKEGIIVIDINEKIIRINKSATEMLNIEVTESDSRKIREIITDKDFGDFIEEAIISTKTMEDSIGLLNSREQFIQIYSSPIYKEENRRNGTLIVLNDITRIKKLENVRRDFVANVSHELRTPITSIKGFVETLLDGDMNDKEEVKTFLDIVLKHVNRLNAIIEDLLSISRLEQGQEKSMPSLEKCIIKNILVSGLQVSAIKARPKNITINIDCPDNIQANVNSSLLEQAIINLVDNAINYSNEGTVIEIKAEENPERNPEKTPEKNPEEIIIKVKDQGCGIPKDHLPRIFERFYRVDKARSRKQGETGLGLAIVKHIVQTHGGHVKVESEVGVGSCFYIHLPQKSLELP